MEFPIAFLLDTFMETQRKWSTTEQEAYGVYYAITKWNYYLQGANITVKNDHKPLAWFLNGKNANNKVYRWSLELATYNITFKWISGATNKAADCLARLVKPISTSTSVNMLTASFTDEPAFTLEVTHNTLLLVPPQPHTQIHHPRFLRNPLLPQNHSQQTTWIHYCKCREQTHSVNAFPRDY